MKKGYACVIVVLLLIIVVLLCMLVKKDNSTKPLNISNEVNNSSIDTNEDNTVLNEEVETAKEDEYIVQKGNSNETDSFYGYSRSDWENFVIGFYKKEYEIILKSVEVSFSKDDQLSIKVYDEEDGLIDEYKVNSKNGVAVSSFEVPIDFIKGDFVEYPYKSKIEFTDSICMGVGQIDLKFGEEAIARKYLENKDDYKNITIVNYPEGGSQAFIIIPRYKDMEFSIQSCHIGDDGELYGDDYLLEKVNGPIIIKNVEIEYMPKFMINVSYRGFEMSYPLTFSGEDGSIYLDEYASEIMDISM